MLGLLILALAGLLLVLFVVGAWNPWRLVVLSEYFGSPPIGLTVVMALVFAGTWLAYPVRNETVDRGRARVRIVAVVGAVIGGITWGLLGQLFAPTITEVAHSSDNERTVALVERGDQDRELHLWVGEGMSRRDVGILGPACGHVLVRFLTDDAVQVGTNYGDWEIDLDPATGRPLEVFGPHCASGPRPATLDQ